MTTRDTITVEPRLVLGDQTADAAWSFYHCSDSLLNPGDLLVPATQVTASQWQARPQHNQSSCSEGLAHYDADLVYLWDQRMLAASPDPSGWQCYLDMLYLYRVDVDAAGLAPDPERDALVALYEASHGHPFTGDSLALVHADCGECLEASDGGYAEGPEWYHPFLWATPGPVRVAERLDFDAGDLDGLLSPQQLQWVQTNIQ